ncbi:phospholipase C type enzyme [Suhomyces tanzawaensis NRRL Y-17324]|uniref:Phospholipase C type enzyme n=1 Tax=Suhomyces tanzawaensis NRRL Y-17324 TaxID=984487 RepID=A0A1E4SKW0_9ASCO|nr:phospholipase C type enzyme [Suhomyces tanzawaensis NRRL Y-17324]ODV80130.1 phospholipase C type enzyme [Suhomyces tanzawaensis NRRL Y-17324]
MIKDATVRQTSPFNQSVKLLTFNTWGLKYVSKHRKQRLEAIATRLGSASEEQYDIVALQEVWCEGDWETIEEECRELYPYRRFFKSGIVSGPGLALLSKIPIDETFLYRFPINGRPSAFHRGDWLVGKSIAVTILKPHVANALPIAILNSHMHAPYAHSGDASYSCHRACQAWDFSKLVKMLRRAGYAVIQVGDLNSKPESLPYKLFTVEGGLVDSWDACNEEKFTPNQIAQMQPQEQIELAGTTCDSQLNTWRATRRRWEACRLDYALVDPNNIKSVNASVKFTELMPAPYSCSYSDHFAYSAELLIKSKEEAVVPADNEDISTKLELYRELIAEIVEYRKHTIPFQATWRKYHFFGSLALVFILHIAVSFASIEHAWLSVIIMFLSTIIGITGVINGMMWLLGVRSELRALQEVQMEVEDIYASHQSDRK